MVAFLPDRPAPGHSRTLALALALALAALSACGALRPGNAERSELLLSATPPRSAACAVETVPEELPGVDALVDSAGLAAAAVQLMRGDPPGAGMVLLSLAFAPDGTNVDRRVIEHSTSATVADSIQRLVFAARREAPEAELEWGARLRIDLAEPVTLRVGRREVCPPEPRSPEMREAMQRYTPAGVRYRGGRRERVVHVRVDVSRAGTVSSASIVAGDLRGSALERDLERHLRQFLFDPATVDGAPASGSVEVPVRVRG